MNTESILSQFDVVKKSITRAELPFITGMIQKPVLDVSLYELIKSIEQINNIIIEISPERFSPYTKSVKQLITPIISLDKLNVCEYCGDPDCTSDHK